jgi:hypothetical protein
MSLVSPVFIVGAARSGTTALATALHQGAGYSGFGEGHLSPLLGQLTARVRTYYKNKQAPAQNQQCLLAHVPQSDVIAALKDIFRTWCERSFGPAPWFEKTPDSAMIMACPDLLSIWPNAIAIYVKRRPIDNVLSRMRKFKSLSFENACEEWVRCTRCWDTVRPKLAERFLEIDQIEMIESPATTSARVARALDLNPDLQQRFQMVLRDQRPEQTNEAAWTPLSQTGWSSEQIDTFRSACGDLMRVAGYGEEQYWNSSPPL